MPSFICIMLARGHIYRCECWLKIEKLKRATYSYSSYTETCGPYRAEQTASQGEVRNSPREAVRIKSNMFNIFLTWARSIKHPIKYMAFSFSRDFRGSRWRRRKKLRRHWFPVRMPCILLDAWLTELSSILTMAAHSEEFDSRSQKYQTCLILSSRPREANCSPKFSRTREETAEQTASWGSFLSSFLTVVFFYH